MFKKLPKTFYRNPDTVFLSQELLGKYLMTRIGGKLTGGMILETESYMGPEDRAAHSFNGKYTERTKIMYHPGGVAYVYLCYGIHSLFNIITNLEGVPHGILIRAIRPEIGLETILERRHKKRLDRTVGYGPGSVARCLGITVKHRGVDLTGDTIWVEDRNVHVAKKDILISKRIGVEYAEEWAEKPLRFTINDATERRTRG